MSKVTAKALHRKWMRNPGYRAEFETLCEEFTVIDAMIGARVRAGLTQAQLAARMKTTREALARLESGRALPSIRTLHKVADATGTALKISFEAASPKRTSRATTKVTRPLRA